MSRSVSYASGAFAVAYQDVSKLGYDEALYDNTYLDCGVSFYSNIDKAVEDLKLGQPKFKFSWDEFEARQGQKFLGL